MGADRCTASAGLLEPRGGNQLQKFLRIIEPLLEFGAQRLGGKLGSNGIFAGGGIGGYELDFIDADRGILVITEGFLDLLGEVLRFGAAHGKGADQAGKVVERNLVRKQDAGEPRGGQQLCEAALGLSGFERDAIEKKFVVRDAKQKTSVAALGQRLLEFAPSSLELPLGAFVVRSVQPGVLDQNVEAVEKRPSRGAAAGIGLRGVSDSSLLPVYGALATRLSGKVTECTITEVIEPNEWGGAGDYTEGQVLWDAGALHWGRERRGGRVSTRKDEF